MMAGDFERSWFLTDSDEIDHTAVSVFVAYQFLINIVLLNVLIAVVSDSYDYAQIRAAKLFMRARIELAAELVAIGAAKSLAMTGATPKKGAPQLLRTILKPLESFLRTTTDNEEETSGDDEWQGRALDQERRTQNIVKENVAMLKTDLARFEGKTDQVQQALDHKITKLDERISGMESSIEERIEKSNKDIEERIEKLNKDIEERIEKSNKELMEAIQQLMIKR